MKAAFPGFGKGIELGRALREKFFSNEGMVIAHRIKGRRRYICQALRGNAKACSDLEKLLGTVPGITFARVSPILGSVTVSYTQTERNINALFDALSHEIAGTHAIQEETIIPTGALSAGDCLSDAARGIASRIGKFINHTEPAFLTRIAGLALLVYGVNRIVFNGDRPAGPQILLWGLALLARPSHPDPKPLNEQGA
ncbi:MAG: HMA2 domain-containing protein [Succinivibrio sp.]